MRRQVKEGLYWFSEQDYRERRAIKVWYSSDMDSRGWHCAPLVDGKPQDHTYPLSPDIWEKLKSEVEMQRLTGEVQLD